MKKIIAPAAIFCSLFFLFKVVAAADGPSAAPASAAEIIKAVLARDGIAKAREKFAELRNAAPANYAFSEKEFLELGAALGQAGDHAAAVGIFQLCQDVFPDSPDILSALARAYRAAGDEPLSYKYFRLSAAARRKLQLRDFLERNRGKLAATAAEVIQRHLEATGGEQAWRDIKTMVMKFSVHDTSGSRGFLIRYYKRPGFYRQGFEGGRSFNATDGRTVWQVTDGEWREIKETDYIRMASIDNSFIDYAAAGVTYDWVGVKILNNAPVYRLKRTYSDGYAEDLFFSVDAGYLTEKLTPYNIGPTYFTFWDYRQVGDILVPHVQFRNMGDMAPPHGLVLKEIRINEPLDDSLFIKPDKK